MDSKASAASAILRRLAVALKTYALYPPPSPVTDRAIAEVLVGLHTYIEANGPFNVRVAAVVPGQRSDVQGRDVRQPGPPPLRPKGHRFHPSCPASRLKR